jgi:L-iditol 2-dehydrogenase
LVEKPWQGEIMKALVKEGYGRAGIFIRNIPVPVPGTGEIKVKVLAAGICGTDIHIMNDEYAYHPPVVLGHEYIGIVAEVGADAEDFAIGDYVVSLTAAITCGKCRYCREGLLMLCDKRLSIGSGTNGAMAEYMKIPSRLAFKVPETIENKEELVMAEPLACAVRAVLEQSRVKAGDIVLVSGPGTIGLLVLQLAKIQGAYVIVSGLPQDAKRLGLALELGADKIISDPDSLQQVIRESDPYGVDAVFECSGASQSIDACLEALRKQGTYTQVGLFGKNVAINFDKFLYKEITITTSFAQERTSWITALRLMENGKLRLAPLISHRIPLDEWEKGFDMFMNREGNKIVLMP